MRPHPHVRLGVDVGTLISLVPPEGDNRSEEIGGNKPFTGSERNWFLLGLWEGGIAFLRICNHLGVFEALLYIICASQWPIMRN